MALNSRIKKFGIVVNSNTYDIPVSSMTLRDVIEEYSEPKTAVGGRRYVQLAGVRREIRISYQKSFSQSEWRNLTNDIITHMVTNGNQFFDFYRDSSQPGAETKIEVQPKNLEYLVRYENQIGRLIPSLTLIQRDRQTSIPVEFEGP